ncbi:MAG: hypothetical protein IKX60_02815 [Bacteroidales bacterium]|nr:hypothetical protein [Bacteroidales bacterium]
MKKALIILTALGVLMWTGCAPVELVPEEVPGKPVLKADSTLTLTVRAEMSNPETKALAIDGTDEANTTLLKSMWLTGEEVYVYLGEELIGKLKAVEDATDPHYATLTGEVTAAGITPGQTQLTLLTPYSREDWTYVGQGGILLVNDGGLSGLYNSIAARYHLAQAENVLVTGLTTDDDGKGTLTTSNAVFENQQSVYRLSFRFQNGGVGEKTPITAVGASITGDGGGLWKGWNMGTGPISVWLNEPTADPFFVALRFEDQTNAEALNFEVIGEDGVTYLGSKTIPAEYKPNGNFVSIKNATLTERLKLDVHSADKVNTVL